MTGHHNPITFLLFNVPKDNSMIEERKGFSFFNSYWKQIQILDSKEEKLKIFEAICEVQFLEKDLEDIQFDDKLSSVLWESMKYNLKKSIDGYKSQKKIDSKIEEIDITYFTEQWNILAAKLNLVKVIKLTDSRKIQLISRTKETKDFKSIFNLVLQKIEHSSFLLGDNDKDWKICFDWIIKNDKNYIKVLEGKYE